MIYGIKEYHVLYCLMKDEAAAKDYSPNRSENYTLIQYRFFNQMEHYLQEPRNFFEQMTFPFPSDIKQILIEKYYSYDDQILRELFDKKLNSRSRKDLDEISESTKLPLNCCRRQV